MKIAVLSDVHLIAQNDPYKKLHEIRGFFKCAWPSFQDLLKRINREAPDVVILLGDLVDWFSPENVAFGLDLMSILQVPWYMTPGNHDLAHPDGDEDLDRYQTQVNREHADFWAKQGVVFSNRVLGEGSVGLVLMDSALSYVPKGTEAWVDEVLNQFDRNLLFTHVPIDKPPVREYILSVDPNRSMKKYVLSGTPDLYDRCLKNRVEHVFTGHLHFPGLLELDGTGFYLCDMSITMHDPNRNSSSMASAWLVQYEYGQFGIRKLTVE
ncbi:MAG: metallophosphoesterase [bacterium]|nr:metallophosphoesterase [bacterium]